MQEEGLSEWVDNAGLETMSTGALGKNSTSVDSKTKQSFKDNYYSSEKKKNKNN